MARKLYESNKQQEFFDLLDDPKNITSSIITKLFGRSLKTGIRFYQDDEIKIGPKESPFVKPDTITTVGIYIANKFIFEDLKIFGYVNKTLDGGLIKDIGEKLATARLEEDITLQQVFDYIDRTQWLFGGTLAHIINTSLSETILTLPDKAKKKRSKLLKEHDAEIKAQNQLVAADIETEVTDIALEEMRKKHDPAMALFDSKAGVDPYNNYKTMFVMKGPIVDNTGLSPTGYKIVTSDYNDGVSKEDMSVIADALVTGAYSRGISTAESGYSAKKYNAMFQRSQLGPRGSDCHSTETVEVKVTKDNAEQVGLYHFIMEDDKPVLLTPKTVNKYIGKTVHMRTPAGCKMKDPYYCNVCYGDMTYRLGIKNVGMTYNGAANALLNSSLKKFHDIRVVTTEIGVDDFLSFSDK